MKKIVTFSTLLFAYTSFCLLNAQAQWAKAYGFAPSNSIQQTNDGGYITAGGLYGFYAMKIYPDGEVEWARTYGANYNMGTDVQQTSDGGYIFVGGVRDSFASNYNLCVLKLYPNGEIEWQKSYVGDSNDIPHVIRQTIDGGYIVAGQTETVGVEYAKTWILKLYPNGEIEWQKSYRIGGFLDWSNSIQQTIDGGYICCGYSFTSYAEGQKGWVFKLYPNGEIEWQKKYPSTGLYSVLQISDGGYVAAGFDSAGCAWILKLYVDGEIEWKKSYKVGTSCWLMSLKQTHDGGFIGVGGTWSDTGDPLGDILALRLFPDGEIVWQRTFGVYDKDWTWGGIEEGDSVQESSDGGFIILGRSDSFPGPLLSWILFILKLGPEGGIDLSCGKLMGVPDIVISNPDIIPQVTETIPQETFVLPQYINISSRKVNFSPYLVCQSTIPNPVISELLPKSGIVSVEVAILGSNLGSTPGTVTFNGVTASISSWTNTQIMTTVPSGATTGPVVVYSSSGKPSNGIVFTVMPIPPANQAPSKPSSLSQFRSDGITPIQIGAETTEDTVVFKGSLNDPDGDRVKLQIELRRLDEFNGQFDETKGGLKEGEYVNSGDEAIVVIYARIDGNYHWRARVIDEHGKHSEWIEFGNNNILDTDLTIVKLKEDIDRQLRRMRIFSYPQYLLDPNSFKSAVYVVWLNFSDWATRQELTKIYDEFYYSGINYDNLALKSLRNAKDFYNKGDFENSKKYLNNSEEYKEQSEHSFQGAVEIFNNNLSVAEEIAEGIRQGCVAAREGVILLLHVVNPPAADAADYIFITVDFAANSALLGLDEAERIAIRDLVTKITFSEVEFPFLDNLKISDFVKTSVGKDLIPAISKALSDNKLLTKLIEELAVKYGEKIVKDLFDAITGEAKSSVNYKRPTIHSPAELRVYGSLGQITGLIDGEVKNGISRSVYDNEMITIFQPDDIYIYEAKGIENGSYGLEIISVENGESTTFNANEIPITRGAIHKYVIDWEALSRGEEGVTITIDSNGDGLFEITLHAGKSFSFLTAKIEIDPDTLNLKSNGNWITCYIELPKEYDPMNIDTGSIKLKRGEDIIVGSALSAPKEIGDYDKDGTPDLMIKFNRATIIQYLKNKNLAAGNLTLSVIGQIKDKIFGGTDTIKIIN